MRSHICAHTTAYASGIGDPHQSHPMGSLLILTVNARLRLWAPRVEQAGPLLLFGVEPCAGRGGVRSCFWTPETWASLPYGGHDSGPLGVFNKC